MGGRGAYPTQSSGCPSFTAAPPHTLSFNATIQLHAVGVPKVRRTHAASQPLTTHMDIAHRPAQPPTGAAFWPIGCSIRASGRPPGPSAPPERRPHDWRERQEEKLVAPKGTLPPRRAGWFQQLTGMYRWCWIRCRRRPRAPKTSRASGADIVTPAEAVEAPRTHQERDLARRRNGPAHSAASLVPRRHVPRVPRCGALLGRTDPLRHCNGRCAAGLHSRTSILSAPPAA